MSPAVANPAARLLTIFLVAAEESGDRLGAALMRAVRSQNPSVRFLGVGGRDMEREGLRSLFPVERLSIIGLAAIPRQLPTIFRRIGETAAAAVHAQPHVLVIIDSPDFTHRVARRVRRQAPDIPIIDYVSPSVWAWRPGRARRMRAYVDHILALLPFEPEVHAKLGGPACSYVGHPLIDEIDTLRPNEEEQRRRAAEPPVILVLPGSRRSEIRRLLATFAQTTAVVHEQTGPLEIIIPTVPHLLPAIEQAGVRWPVPPRLVTAAADKRAAFRIARAALVKSGTVTLETALAGVPMVAAYKVSRFEAIIARRVIKVPSVILANLVLGENMVPEFLQEACTPDNMARALLPLLHDTPERERQTSAFRRLDDIMGVGQASPAIRAAGIVLKIAHDGANAANLPSIGH
jgi:lipid-A-disaccharide synthase